MGDRQLLRVSSLTVASMQVLVIEGLLWVVKVWLSVLEERQRLER